MDLTKCEDEKVPKILPHKLLNTFFEQQIFKHPDLLLLLYGHESPSVSRRTIERVAGYLETKL